ncbi:MAG TPA: DUF1349 domain-containing protein [Erwinia sp.]|uniref:DUF1349 domain-containing protein n=1 Tax=Erwinia citreus TaxID=558 RepID=UPI000E9AF28A|nr:DUF1349 domain-containing protein [Erwinia sp.]HBV38611.1 DUF1349 domain-containing protein [Erwinia sp.]
MVVIDSLKAEAGVWINRPDEYSFESGKLRLTTADNTDFWEQTYYGFQRHTGHAYGFYVEEDFTLQVKVMADFCQLYDQAGIFIRDDEQHWVKAGIEFNDDRSSIGCVVTREKSDWSTGLFPGNPQVFWMRATLENEALRIQYSTDGEIWPLLRLCHWPKAKQRFIGVMGCTPERQGLEITFADFSIGLPSGKPLHDLT